MARPDLRLVHDDRDAAARVPPHHLELERDILGAVLVTESRALVAKLRGVGLAPEHFFDTNANGRIWQAICALADEPGGEIGLRALTEWLRAREWTAKVGGFEYLGRLMDEQSTLKAPAVLSFAKRVIALSRLRQLQATAHRIANEIYFDVGDPEEYLRRAPQSVVRACEVTTSGTVETFADTLKRTWAAITTAGDAPGGYQTGLPTYDAQLGGLHPSEVLLVSGKEKSGKSVLVGQWCADVAARKRVVKLEDGTEQTRGFGSLIFSLDAAKTTDWAERVAAAEACVNLENFRTGTATDGDRSAFAAASDNVSKLPVYVDGEHVSTVGQMGARIRAVRDELAERGVDLAVVAIDYIQIAHGEGQTREAQLGSAMRAIISLASQPDLRGIAWVVISQTNNEGEIAQCRALAQMCDAWVHLTVDDDKETTQGWNHPRGWITATVYPARIDVKRGRRGAMGARAKPIPLWCCYQFTFFYCE